MEMKRVVVFLPPQTVKASEALAARYGSNRSACGRGGDEASSGCSCPVTAGSPC